METPFHGLDLTYVQLHVLLEAHEVGRTRATPHCGRRVGSKYRRAPVGWEAQREMQMTILRFRVRSWLFTAVLVLACCQLDRVLMWKKTECRSGEKVAGLRGGCSPTNSQFCWQASTMYMIIILLEEAWKPKEEGLGATGWSQLMPSVSPLLRNRVVCAHLQEPSITPTSSFTK